MIYCISEIIFMSWSNSGNKYPFNLTIIISNFKKGNPKFIKGFINPAQFPPDIIFLLVGLPVFVIRPVCPLDLAVQVNRFLFDLSAFVLQRRP